tara:strand:+ start:25335 stop:25679 length:345 start_codon:yes stop_codon:yes gene_type:complete
MRHFRFLPPAILITQKFKMLKGSVSISRYTQADEGFLQCAAWFRQAAKASCSVQHRFAKWRKLPAVCSTVSPSGGGFLLCAAWFRQAAVAPSSRKFATCAYILTKHKKIQSSSA